MVKLDDGENCPPETFCLYRDYQRKSPAYGIEAGYDLDLSALNMSKTVSSWVNNT